MLLPAIQVEMLFLSPNDRVIVETISENPDPARADVKGCSFSLNFGRMTFLKK